MIKVGIGFLIAFLVGAASRYFELPVPAPPKITGALLVMFVSLGYISVDRLLASRREALPVESTNSPSEQTHGQ